MKKILPVLLLSGITVLAHGQSISYREKLYASGLNDTITYTVYIPQDWEGWDRNESHPAIYAINYGMINGDYLAAQVAYFRKARYAMPNSLVVVIDASMEHMGYRYETGTLTEQGNQFVNFLKKQLIPHITRQYHTSGFRTYIGHSFASSFCTNLFLNEPGLFNAFILLAPEKIGPEQPPFHLSEQAKDYYNKHYTFLYCAVGEDDLQRRKDFAQEIGYETAVLNKEHFFFQYDSIARADHTNILTLSIEFALKNIYRFYTPYSGKDESNALADLKNLTTHIRQYYDLEPEKNFTFYNPFAQEAIKYKDTTALKSILRYFESPRLKGWNIMQFGEYCLRLQLKDQAQTYFEQAISQINSQELNTTTGLQNLLACYNHMAFDIYPDQPGKGMTYLLKSLRLSQHYNHYLPDNGAALLTLGKYTNKTGYQLKEGLNYLITYQKNNYPRKDMAAYYAAAICRQLNQPEEARKYLNISLKENPNNQDALKLAKDMNVLPK